MEEPTANGQEQFIEALGTPVSEDDGNEEELKRIDSTPSPLRKTAPLFVECRKALSVLDHFTVLANCDDNRVAPCFLRYCHGVILLTSYKAALVGGVQVGSGVVLAQVTKGKWSAPCMVTVWEMGLGLQVGLKGMSSMLLVLNKELLEGLKAGHTRFKVSLGFEMDTGLYNVDGSMEWPVPFADTFSYQASSGLFGGVNMNMGGLYVRKKANVRCYGKHRTPAQLLSHSIYSKALDLPLDALAAANRLIRALELASTDDASSAHGDSVDMIRPESVPEGEAQWGVGEVKEQQFMEQANLG